MMKEVLMALRYLISSEESRIGRQNYWNSVYLAAKTSLLRVSLELGKVMLILILCISIMMLNQL